MRMTADQCFADARARYWQARSDMAALAVPVLLEQLAACCPDVTHFVLATPCDADDLRDLELVVGDFVVDCKGKVVDWISMPTPPDMFVDDLLELLPTRSIFNASVAEQQVNRFGNTENYVSVAILRSNAADDAEPSGSQLVSQSTET